MRASHIDERPRCTVHGDGTLPLSNDTERHWPSVGIAEGSGAHTDCEVVDCALVVVAVSIGHHLQGHRALRCPHRSRVWVLGVRQVALVGVQLGTLLWAEEAENAPHAAAAVEFQHTCHVGRLDVSLWRVAVSIEEIENVRGRLHFRAPPAHLLSQLAHSRAVQEVLRVAQVHFPDREAVADGHYVVVRHALCCPNCAGIVLARHDVEIPKFTSGVCDGEAF
mmetsp:Transcript_66941/g.169050  ORF Transcript_66941/g.169050 Transcript_66941/m.169050 type:complete len:222 (+) Transcript_66941:688-1353(+)